MFWKRKFVHLALTKETHCEQISLEPKIILEGTSDKAT